MAATLPNKRLVGGFKSLQPESAERMRQSCAREGIYIAGDYTQLILASYLPAKLWHERLECRRRFEPGSALAHSGRHGLKASAN